MADWECEIFVPVLKVQASRRISLCVHSLIFCCREAQRDITDAPKNIFNDVIYSYL